MKKLFYPSIFQKEEDGGYTIEIPDIEGCVTYADTLEQGYEMISEALAMVLEYMEDNKEPFPTPSSPKDFELGEDDFVVSVEFDLLAYRMKMGKKSVRKTVTIPMWLDNLATEQNISFSNVLQEGLKERIKY